MLAHDMHCLHPRRSYNFIGYDNAIISDYNFTYSSVVIPIFHIPDIINPQYFFKNGKCILYTQS